MNNPLSIAADKFLDILYAYMDSGNGRQHVTDDELTAEFRLFREVIDKYKDHVLAPAEPTEKMKLIIENTRYIYQSSYDLYKAMIEAAKGEL